ncbi:MAG TPA: ABC transporter permease [Pyrinomonadaceae bacterium]|nr:ABC transporter permease [Pyrinomonadaceae bacterium]
MPRLNEIVCVFRIQLANMRGETGPFLLAAVVFPSAMYLFAGAVGGAGAAGGEARLRFLAGSIVFSLSLTSISWLGYLMLENRFTGRLRLFATLPLAPSSYLCGFLAFALAQGALSTAALLAVGRWAGVPVRPSVAPLALVVVLTVLCLCGLGALVAARARSFTEGSLMTDALGAGLVFLAPVYYAPEAMPGWLGAASRWLPTTFAASAIRTALSGGHEVYGEVSALALTAAATLALGLRLTNWREG